MIRTDVALLPREQDERQSSSINPDELVLYTVSLIKSLHRLIMSYTWYQLVHYSLCFEKSKLAVVTRWLIQSKSDCFWRKFLENPTPRGGICVCIRLESIPSAFMSTLCRKNEAKCFPHTHTIEMMRGLGLGLPEVTVRVDDPHSKGFDPGLLGSDALMTAKHAQGELVDTRLQHGAKLLLEESGLFPEGVLHASTWLCVLVQQAIGICRVIVIMSLDQGEERLGDVALRGRGPGRSCPLGAASPSWEAGGSPAVVSGSLWFVNRTLTDASLAIYTPRRTGHFGYSLHFEQNGSDVLILWLVCKQTLPPNKV